MMGPQQIVNCPETNLHCREFSRIMMVLFNICGLYAHIITSLGVNPGHRAPEHFPFSTSNLNMVHMALWLFDHNLVIASPDVAALEEYCSLLTREQPNIIAAQPQTLTQWIKAYGGLIANYVDEFRYPEVVPDLTQDYTTAVSIIDDVRSGTGTAPTFDTQSAPPVVPTGGTTLSIPLGNNHCTEVDPKKMEV